MAPPTSAPLTRTADQARHAAARALAIRCGRHETTTLDLLYGLCRAGGGAANVLAALGVDPARVADEVEARLLPSSPVPPPAGTSYSRAEHPLSNLYAALGKPATRDRASRALLKLGPLAAPLLPGVRRGEDRLKAELQPRHSRFRPELGLACSAGLVHLAEPLHF